ncbi:hypothetical protein MVEN_00915900 [Mycena venus]|uniref:DUF6533 domain-containing protein n=1 Tax=Mycena venus TaxID=2733690 RepID=A0A8H7D232_9AGAR|nr:hypothetical protein MVEN_00915900 [Mycena venus]
MQYNPNYLQGSAVAALTWVVYDVCLSLDREIVSVWRSSWSLSKILFLFSRYHTILSLGFFLMECSIWNEAFLDASCRELPWKTPASGLLGSLYSEPPSAYNTFFSDPRLLTFTSYLQYTNASRWYIGLTEVFSILAGELLILIRINTVYGWSRKIVALTLFLFCAETVIGLVTTVISLLGGSKGLFGSRNILICGPNRVNVPDVNIAMWLTSMAVACVYIGLVILKALDIFQEIEATDGRSRAYKVGLVAYFKSSRVTLPILHRWLLATYSVASTRIFLNLKELALPANNYNGVTWSEFQQNSRIGAPVTLWAAYAYIAR